MGSTPHFFTLVFFLLVSTPPAAGQIRLAGPGSTWCSGRVEIYYNNEWGTVCDDSWDPSDAKVVCRQLNCGTALEAPRSAHFRPGTGPIWLDDVACSGSERSLSRCRHRGFGTHDCNHNEDASVVCSGVQIRLAGSTLCSGRVEIYHNGAWGTVCDDSWNKNHTNVVCKQLNCGTGVSATHSALFGEGSGQIWLDDVTCSGSERSLTDCGHKGFGTHNCKHAEDAGVVCSVSLPKSSITMSPSGEVAWGQDASITCSTSGLLLNGTFILRQTAGLFRKAQTSSTNSSTFSITKVDFDREGSYQCQYEKRISAQTFSSSLSDSVRLSVTVKLPRPNIYLTIPHASQVWDPEGAVVTWGYSFVFTCFINSSYPGGRFLLIFSGNKLIDSKLADNSLATFNFPAAEYQHQGNYSCVYEVTVSSRNFTATTAAPINVIIKVSLSLLASSITTGILVLLLLVVLVVVCLVRRRRRRAKQPVVFSHTEMAARGSNTYASHEDSEEDYVNADQVDTKMKLKEEAARVEEEEDSDDQDYENGPDENYTISKEIYVSVVDNGEEDEYSDDENDYENVTPLVVEETDDIYENF